MQVRDDASQASVSYCNTEKKSLEKLLNKNSLFRLEPKYPLKGQQSDKSWFLLFSRLDST